jgi:hypothetical protein
MKVSSWCAVSIKELEHLSEYTAIYRCSQEVKKQKPLALQVFQKLRDILEEIIEEDSTMVYGKEFVKIEEFLAHNQISEVSYESHDMWHVVLESGLMNKATTQLLVDYEGLCDDELEAFKEDLARVINGEVHALYEEIERNLNNDARSRR